MKHTLIGCALLLSILLLGGCSRQQVEAYIDTELAKSTALQDAGLTLDDVDFDTIVLDKRNGLDYYELSFTANGQEYRYNIDALTGTVIEKKLPESSASSASDSIPLPSPPSSSSESIPLPPASRASSASSTPTDKNTITAATAKAKALAHAGLTADKVSFVKAELDWDDGKRTYEVEFYTTGKEYDYEIDAYTGDVISYDHDAEHYNHTDATSGATPKPSTSGSSTDKATITAEAAKKTALAQVPGATAKDIREFETDYDDGRLAYEGKIIYDGNEYEFEIDGYSGAIRSWEVEPVGR